jgi:hypothetical protein
MIKLKQAECGHWVKRDAPENATVTKAVRSFEVGYAVTHEMWTDKDVSVVFCKKCIERIENET